MDEMKVFIPITKIDAAKRLVYGLGGLATSPGMLTLAARQELHSAWPL